MNTHYQSSEKLQLKQLNDLLNGMFDSTGYSLIKIQLQIIPRAYTFYIIDDRDPENEKHYSLITQKNNQRSFKNIESLLAFVDELLISITNDKNHTVICSYFSYSSYRVTCSSSTLDYVG